MLTERMRARWLRRVLDQTTVLRLYISVGGEDAVVEVSGGGYQPRILTLADWSFQEREPVQAEVTHDFRFNGDRRLMILGSYLTQQDGGLLWLKEFREPLVAEKMGDIIPVHPIMKLGAIS
jgi:hypothetical protein